MTNKGRRSKRKNSSDPSSPKKKAKKTTEILAKDIEKEADSTLDQSELSHQSDLSLGSIENSPNMTSSPQRKDDGEDDEEMTEADFKRKVLASLGGLSAKMDTMNARFDKIEKTQKTHSKDIKELRDDLDTHKRSLHNTKLHIKKLQEKQPKLPETIQCSKKPLATRTLHPTETRESKPASQNP